MKKLFLLVLPILPLQGTAQSATVTPAFTTTGAFIAHSVPDLEASTR